MAPRKPPKILLDKDPLPAVLPATPPSDDAVLLHAPSEPSEPSAAAAPAIDATAAVEAPPETSALKAPEPEPAMPEPVLATPSEPEPAVLAAPAEPEPEPVVEAAPVAEAPVETAPVDVTPPLAPAVPLPSAIDSPAETVAAMVEETAAAADTATDRAAAFVEEAVATTADAVAAAAEAVEKAAAPDRIETRVDAALELPRLMSGFMQRQTRRTVDGAMGLARCRSLADAVELQGSLIRESMDDFVQANTDIAFRSLAVITGQRSTIC